MLQDPPAVTDQMFKEIAIENLEQARTWASQGGKTADELMGF